MNRPLRVLPLAEAELAAAAEWYEDRCTGLGVELVAEADAAFDLIRELPESAPVWDRDPRVRKHRVRRFPYLVFYRVKSVELEVVAFAHEKRSPGYWVGR